MKGHLMLRQIVVLVLIGGTGAGLLAQAGFSRVVLQDHPVSVVGRHGVTARAEFAPGASAGLHRHPGEEFGYIVEGTIALSVDGRATATLTPGDVFFIPAGVAHDGRNVGETKAALVSVFFAEDGKPLASPVSSTGNNPQGRR
jgi:quercetin dioxygenase-like cupin family protein